MYAPSFFGLSTAVAAAIAVIAPAALAAAADTRQVPAAGTCPQPVNVAGRHVPSGRAPYSCTTEIARPRSASEAIDADDAYIRDILRRYENVHIEERPAGAAADRVERSTDRSK